jgi:hypothetical protein
MSENEAIEAREPLEAPAEGPDEGRSYDDPEAAQTPPLEAPAEGSRQDVNAG